MGKEGKTMKTKTCHLIKGWLDGESPDTKKKRGEGEE